MQLQSRGAIIVVPDICILQENRGFDVERFGDDARVIGGEASEFGESSEGFFVALLEEEPSGSVRVEDHSDAEDECR
jgi:hypothetical protein